MILKNKEWVLHCQILKLIRKLNFCSRSVLIPNEMEKCKWTELKAKKENLNVMNTLYQIGGSEWSCELMAGEIVRYLKNTTNELEKALQF